jgi:hypothetical protein
MNEIVTEPILVSKKVTIIKELLFTIISARLDLNCDNKEFYLFVAVVDWRSA